MKSIAIIVLVVVAFTIVFLFYVERAINWRQDEDEAGLVISDFGKKVGAFAPAPSSTPASQFQFFPPVFVGPKAEPKIMGPKGPPP